MLNSRFFFFSPRHAIPLLMLGLLGPAQAQSPVDDLGRVEVSGKRPADIPRLDVIKTCPQAGEKLNDALAYPAYLEGATGTVRVEFKLRGGRVSDVQPMGGPRVLYRDIRRAVARMGCNGDGDREQSYAFQIKFMAPGEVPQGESPVALLTMQ